MDGLFPDLPEDIKAVSDEDLAALLVEHEEAKNLIDAEDEKFLGELSAEEILAELEKGANQNELLRAEQAARSEAHEAFIAKKEEQVARFEVKADEPEPEDEGDGDDGAKTEEAPVEVVAEAEETTEPEETEEQVEEEKVLVTASAENTVMAPQRFARRPPAPSPERTLIQEPKKGTALVAAGEFSSEYKDELDQRMLADLVIRAADHYGPHPKVDPPGKYGRYDGPSAKIARAEFEFPEERQLTDNPDTNIEKIRSVVVEGIPGGPGQYSLTASGGLCAPFEPIYTMRNFATDAEPVWDALPKFQARRGGVNVPDVTTIGDITTAISSISEANDALGGTFATKSCQDLECVDYTEVAVQIIAHCREYGNLNARAWPEKIRHENELTMAALASTSEMFILERIKALSVNVTNGAETLGALIYLVDAIVKAKFGIAGRLRMPNGSRFRALIPRWVPDMLMLDTIQTNDGNRFTSRESLVNYLQSVGIDPVFYLDGAFAAGDDQVPDASQAAGALDPLPDTVQWAIYPEGAFLGIDMGVLELGIVRDSVLNATNDFQVFGERFRNVARLAPAQAAYWVTSDLCAIGQFPPAGTARTCD